MRRILAVVLVAVVCAPIGAGELRYSLNGDNTKIEWTGTKPGGKHDGGFKAVTGVATLAEGSGLKIDVSIDCTSLYSDNEKLTQHLKSPDFFAVKTHPQAKFVSSKVEKSAAGYNVTGDLTLLGKTKTVTFPAEITTGDKLGVKAKVTINRLDYGMSYGQGKINDQIEIRVSVNANR